MNAKERRKIRRVQLPLLKTQLIEMRLTGEGEAWLDYKALLHAAYHRPERIASAIRGLQSRRIILPWHFNTLHGNTAHGHLG